MYTGKADFSLSQDTQNSDNASEAQRLGNIASIVVSDFDQYERYNLLSSAQDILTRHNVKNSKDNPHRTRLCMSARAHNPDKDLIEVYKHEDHASLGNIQTCGSVWSCPVCALREALKQADDLKRVFKLAESEGWIPIMLTLTARHTSEMSLAWFSERFRTAERKLSQDSAYQKARKLLDVQHAVKAREVTHGENGWHFHLHGLFFVPKSIFAAIQRDEMDEILHELIPDAWHRKLKNEGLDGKRGIACDWRVHGDIAETYLSKLGLSEHQTTNAEREITSPATKTGGKTIWAILRAAAAGDEEAELLFVEFCKTMFGTNWITYSRGLRGLIEDIELPSDEDDDQREAWMYITDEQYRAVRVLRAYAELLAVVTAADDPSEVRRWLADARRRCRKHDQSRVDDLRQQYARALDKHRVNCYTLGHDHETTKRYYHGVVRKISERLSFYEDKVRG